MRARLSLTLLLAATLTPVAAGAVAPNAGKPLAAGHAPAPAGSTSAQGSGAAHAATSAGGSAAGKAHTGKMGGPSAAVGTHPGAAMNGTHAPAPGPASGTHAPTSPTASHPISHPTKHHHKLTRRERLVKLETAKADARMHPRHGLMALLGVALLALLLKQRRDRSVAAAHERMATGGPPTYQPRAVVLRHGGGDPHIYGEDAAPAHDGVPGTTPLGPDGFSTPPSVAQVAAQHAADARPHEVTALVAPAGWQGGDVGADADDSPGVAWSGAGHVAHGGTPTSLPASATALDIEGNDQASAAAEIERLTHPPAPALPAGRPGSTPPVPAPALRLAEGKDPVGRGNVGSSTSFPPELSPHFNPLAGERVVWSADFRVPLVSDGTVALTNIRLLAVYQRHRLGLLPPRFHTQTRRHQCALGAVTEHGTVGTRRPSFLVVGALLFLWYPAGTLLACLALGLYFGLPRPELAVWSGGVRRLYPLALPDQEEARRTLERLRATPERPLERKAG